jgi:D-glycero-D-manno-heptose 1,7-bisphosphate phosphatase
MTKRKIIDAIFLDRDGIINEVVMRDGVVSSPRTMNEFRLRPDFIDFHREAKQLKVRLFVVSNQPDISRSLMDTSLLSSIDETLRDQFGFDEIVYCTHDDDACCECRKPKPGMIISLLKKYELDPERVIFVGDSPKDVLAGRAARVTTVLLRRPYNAGTNGAEFTVDSLREILEIVTSTEESQ